MAALGAALLLLAGSARAAESIAELKEKLLKHEDFRVRTQAALALGATASPEAVDPLCQGLGDGTDTVRAAAAAALGKLQRGGLDCLRARLDKESDENVRKMIKKAILLIEQAAAGPAITASTKYYLAVATTVDRTAREESEVDALVRAVLAEQAATLAGCALAPREETPEQARKRLRPHPQVLGMLLAPEVFTPEYGDGQLTVRVELRISGHPEGAAMGSVQRSRTAAGVPDRDVAKENDLIRATTRDAWAHFAQLLAQMSQAD